MNIIRYPKHILFRRKCRCYAKMRQVKEEFLKVLCVSRQILKNIKKKIKINGIGSLEGLVFKVFCEYKLVMAAKIRYLRRHGKLFFLADVY